NTDYVNLSLGHLREARNHVDEVLKSANVTGVGIVHPTVDVDKKKRALRLTNHIDRSRSLRCSQSRALVSEFYESELVAPVAGSSHRIECFTSSVRVVWPVRSTG